MLDTGVPALFSSTPALTFNQGSTDLLIGAPPPPSGSGPCPASPALPCILTGQYNNSRTSTNSGEPKFTSSNITPTGFGAVTQFLVDTANLPTGYTHNPVYAQPLYINGLTIGTATKNVVIVATLSSEVYAFDADDTTTAGGTVLWSRDERNTGGTATQALYHDCDTTGTSTGGSLVITPILHLLDFAGMVSTPVIDLVSSPKAIYIASLCSTSDGNSHWWVDAVNLQTGTPLGKIEVVYTTLVSGGPLQAFMASHQLQRPALDIAYGHVAGNNYSSLVVGFGTSVAEMSVQYQGWLFSYDVSNPASPVSQENANPFITECYYDPTDSPKGTPTCSGATTYDSQLPNSCGQGGGIWMSTRGVAANTSGHLFLTSGNGGYKSCSKCTPSQLCTGSPSKITDWGEAAMTVDMTSVWGVISGTASFWPSDYFVPYSVPSGSGGTAPYFKTLNYNDWDMGVTGAVLFDNTYILNGQPQSNTSMVVTGNKRGDSYVLLQSNLGQYQMPDASISRFTLTSLNPTCTNSPGMQCDEPRSLAYLSSQLAVWPWYETLNSFQWAEPAGASQYTFVPGTPVASPFASTFNNGCAGYPGGTVAITYNPAESNDVVWAVATAPGGGSPDCGAQGVRCPGFLFAYKMNGSTGALTQLGPDPSVKISSSTPSLFYVAPMATPTVVNGKAYIPSYKLSDGAGGYTNSGVEVYACASGTGCY